MQFVQAEDQSNGPFESAIEWTEIPVAENVSRREPDRQTQSEDPC